MEAEVIKHPLENEWSIWLFLNKKNKWEDNWMKLATFGTVEDYWCLYHHMKLPSELEPGQDYGVFKSNIVPQWEDRMNVSGGRWLIILNKKSHMDRIWVDLVLLMIGENFGEYNEFICGAIVNVMKSKRKIALWTKDAKSPFNLKIGRILKSKLDLDIGIHYHGHNMKKIIYNI